MNDSQTILLVDDSEDSLFLIREAFKMAQRNNPLQEAHNGEEAIAIFKASMEAHKPFSIAIMDLVIPGAMGGIEAARHILDLAPRTRLIATSGYSNDPAIAEHTTYGFCDAIIKPYSTDELNRILQRALLDNSCQ